MDSSEVIVIEDTAPVPPLPPPPLRHSSSIPANYYYRPMYQERDFPMLPPDQTMIWSQNTADFIKTAMNTALQQSDRILNTNTKNKHPHHQMHPPASHHQQQQQQMRTNPYVHMNPSIYLPYSNFDPTKYRYMPYYYSLPPQISPFSYYPSHILLPSTSNRLYQPPAQPKISRPPPPLEPARLPALAPLPQRPLPPLTYRGASSTMQLPYTISTNNLKPFPEYLNALKNPVTSTKPKTVTVVKQNEETNENSQSSTTIEAIRNQNTSTTATTTSSAIMAPLTDTTNKQNEMDEDEVVFVREFKNDETIDNLNKLEEKSDPVVVVNETTTTTNEVIADDVDDRENINATVNEIDKIGRKRRRASTINTEPRRNPKRQVQIEKEYLRMIGDILLESKREYKAKLKNKFNNNSNSSSCNEDINSSNDNDNNDDTNDKKEELNTHDSCNNNNKISINQTNNNDRKASKITSTQKSTNTKNQRRSLRNVYCGAVYNPPSPLTEHHYRDWPVEGMHERPEYDPLTEKLEPFDAYIRNIKIQFNEKQQEHNADDTKTAETLDDNQINSNPFHDIKIINIKTVDDINENDISQPAFPKLCHEVLHHIFAYVSTVQQLEKEKKNGNDDVAGEETEPPEMDKTKFLNDLNLLQLKKKITEKTVCELLKEMVENIVRKEQDDFQTKRVHLRQLLENSLLLYCVTNNVNQSDVAQYLRTINPDDIIQWSNEQFFSKTTILQETSEI